MNNLLFRPKNLSRNRILETLNETRDVSLILVVAPMGYGKTTVMKEFLKDKEGIKVWMSFGENEADEAWIWRRLCELLMEVSFPKGEEMREMGFPKSKYQINRFLLQLKDCFTEPFYMIFDDCQECECKSAGLLLEAVAFEKIPNLHIILLSRTYPNIQYEEMWMKGVCVLMEQSFLALTRAELIEFFNDNGENITDQEEDQIYEYTEGWISAVYLVLVDYKKNGVFRNQGGITNLVKNFIFDKLFDEEKQILMQMSLFEEFTVEQAVFITKKESCFYLLPKIVEKVGFVKYNSETKTYSLHAVLGSVVSAEREKENMNYLQLYELCAQWYESKEKKIYAIKYYEKANNTEQILKLIEKWNCSDLYEQAPRLIQQFFDRLDRMQCLEYPVAYLPYIYELIIHEDFIKGQKLYEMAKAYYTSENFQSSSKSKILGELLILEWNLHFNDLEKMCHCAVQAYELLDSGKSYIFNSELVLSYGIPELLFLYHNSVGKLKETVELEKKFTTYYMRLINGYEGGWDQLFEAEYHFTRGELEEAEKLANLVCEKAEFRKQPCILISGYMILTRCDVNKGRKEEFYRHMDDLKRKLQNDKRIRIRTEYDLAYSFINGLLGIVDNISSWLKDFHLEDCNRIIRSVRCGCVVYGVLLIEKQQWVSLEGLAEQMRIPYSTSKHVIVMIYALIYNAIAKYHLGDMEKSLEALKEGIDMAMPDGVKMPFVENIYALQPILEELSKTNTYANNLLLMGMEQKRGIKAVLGETDKKILTERESELMELVIKGYKNSQISNSLNVALVTVEKNLTNIYRKLGVTNRTAAIRRLREIKEII